MKVLENRNASGVILDPEDTEQTWSDVDSPAEVDAKIAAAIAAEVIARNAAIAAAIAAAVGGEPYTPTVTLSGGGVASAISFRWSFAGKTATVFGSFVASFMDEGETVDVTLPAPAKGGGALDGIASAAYIVPLNPSTIAIAPLSLTGGGAQGAWVLSASGSPPSAPCTVEVSFAYDLP